jgi:hypothetical protein
VLQSFKGNTDSTETVISNAPGECNISYEIGASHIVLANDIKITNEDMNFVSSCTGYSEYYPTEWDQRKPEDRQYSGILKELLKSEEDQKKSKENASNYSVFSLTIIYYLG